MKKIPGSKASVLTLGVASILAMVYLTAGLASLDFEPARPFNVGRTPDTSYTQPGALPAWIITAVIAVFALILVLIILRLSLQERRKFLWGLVRLAFLGIILLIFMSKLTSGPSTVIPETPEAGVAVTPAASGTEAAALPAPPAQFTPPQVSPWVAYLVTLFILLSITGVWGFILRRRKTIRPVPLDELAGIAQSAVGDLQAGREWGSTILECYFRMTRVVGERRGFKRRASLTPAEFAVELERARLPIEAIHRLTRLFERVRYGAKVSTRKDIDEAVHCLESIVQACGGEA